MKTDKFTAEQVEEAISDLGANLHDRYSGRGMYGAECPAIEAESESEIYSFFVELATVNEKMARQLAKSARVDSMGRGIICYWPSITYAKKDA